MINVIENMPFDEYLKIDAIHNSAFSESIKSAAHYAWAKEHPRGQTPQQRLGELVHTLILEPTEYDERYIVHEKLNRSRKADKERWAELCEQADAEGKKLIPMDEDEKAVAITRNALAHPDVQLLMENAVARELTLLWERSGYLCKARLDLLTVVGDEIVICDVKTTKEARLQPFMSSAYRFGYHRQQYWYSDGMTQCLKQVQDLFGLQDKKWDNEFHFITCETQPPYLCATRHFDSNAVLYGQVQVEQALGTILEAKRQGFYSGYEEQSQVMTLPAWARGDIAELTVHGTESGEWDEEEAGD